MKDGSQPLAGNVPEIHDIGTIDISTLTSEFGEIRTARVIVTDERIQHIKEHHPQDFTLFEKYGKIAIESPNAVIRDLKNTGTVFYVKHLADTNLNVVVRLVTQVDDQTRFNSVMTFYRIRSSNLEKLISKNKLLYKSE